ncbi:MAG: TfoX/Sxy family protein [Mucilaginibacter sp.]
MLNGKMCISVSGEELMCRIEPGMTDQLLEENGTRGMIRNGKTMKGFIYVSEERFRTQKDFDYWIKLVLEYNPKAKASKK